MILNMKQQEIIIKPFGFDVLKIKLIFIKFFSIFDLFPSIFTKMHRQRHGTVILF